MGGENRLPLPMTPPPRRLPHFPLGCYPHQGEGREGLLTMHTRCSSKNNTNNPSLHCTIGDLFEPSGPPSIPHHGSTRVRGGRSWAELGRNPGSTTL